MQEQQEMPLEGGIEWTAEMDRRLKALCMCFSTSADPWEQRAANMRRAFDAQVTAAGCEQRAAQRGFEVMGTPAKAARFGKEAS